MKKFLSACLIAASLAWLSAAALPARAIGSLIDANILAETDCVQTGDTTCQYSLNTFMRVGINVAEMILGLVGALALVVFIYGGVRMLTSGGNAESVTAGKKSIIGAVIGMLLVFGSYTIIKFTVNTLLKPTANYAFSGQINAGDAVVGKADCTAPAPAGHSGKCVASSECKDGATFKANECLGDKVCCAKKLNCTEASSNYSCVDSLSGAHCSDTGNVKYIAVKRDYACSGSQVCVVCVPKPACEDASHPGWQCSAGLSLNCEAGQATVAQDGTCPTDKPNCLSCSSNVVGQ